MRWSACLLVALVLMPATGCTADADGSRPNPSSTSAVPAPSGTVTDVTAEPTLDGTFTVGGKRLFLRCFGQGSPTIVLEAGNDSAGLDVFPFSFIRPLAQRSMTCVHDRAGTGTSSGPTERRRTIRDVVADLHGLLVAAAVPAPYLLVGSSAGGLVDVTYATAHPDQVAGLVLLDAGVPNPHLDREFPGPQGWQNPEHVDWVDAELRLSRLAMPIGRFPVLIVQADPGGEDDPGGSIDQSYWLALSPTARLQVMPGGHDLYQETPDAVAAEVLTTIDAG
jgi:pimeloyl-ACP methyl ester carboxylesterase